MKKIIYILALLLSYQYGSAQLYVNNADLYLAPASLIHVKDSIEYRGSVPIGNYGILELTGNWQNASGTKNVFDATAIGEMNFAGSMPQYLNGHMTLFPYLTVSGGAQPVNLNADVEIQWLLDLTNTELNAAGHTIRVLNSDREAIDYRAGGYVNTSSNVNGWLIRNMDQDSLYVYPLGNIDNDRTFKPLVIRPTKAGYLYTQFQNYDPALDRYSTTIRSQRLTAMGNRFYYAAKLENAAADSGSYEVDLPYNTITDGSYNTLAQWDEANGYWDILTSVGKTGSTYIPNDAEFSAKSLTIGKGEKFLGLGVIEKKDEVVVGDVITPNGDGINDWFKIKGTENYFNMHLTIINRWQSVVYDRNPYQNTQEDGWAAQGLNPGTYFYVLTAVDSEGKKIERKGYIEVIK